MENQEKPIYQDRPGTIVVFANKAPNDNTPHNFYGNLISEEGEENKLQLYTRKSEAGVIYLVGNVAISTKMLNEMSTKIEKDQPNSIVLFLNEKYTPKDDLKDEEKEKPFYTGYYIDSLSNKLNVSLWKRSGKINGIEFFSGKISAN